jgi:flagellar motor switch protein FliM
VPPTDVVVVILFEVEMDQVSGTMTVCLPYSTIEPIIGKLKAGFQSDQMEVDLTWVRRLRERLDQAEVGVNVMLGETTISSHDFTELKEGTILQLDTDVSDELKILVGGVEKFHGYPGVVRGNKAIKISQIVARKV